MAGSILRGQKLKIADCVPHPKNYNQHDDAQLASLRLALGKFGQVAAIVVQAGPQESFGVGSDQFLIIKGHGLLTAAAGLGWAEIAADVLPQDYPEHLALAYLAADNELARMASPEDAQLAALVAEVRDIDAELARLAAGSEERMAVLLDSLVDQAAIATDSGLVDFAGDLAEKWQTKLGQVWLIPSRTLPGEFHRLVIGDCTDVATVAALFVGRQANSMITDPPYGVNLEEKEEAIRRIRPNKRKRTDIANDADVADYRAFFEKFLRCAPLASYNTIYVFMSSEKLHELRLAFDDAGCYFSQYLTWVKNRRVFGRTDYQWQSEFVVLGGARYLFEDAVLMMAALKNGGLSRDAQQFAQELEEAGFPNMEYGDAQLVVYGWRGRHKFYGARGKRSTCIFVDSPHTSPLHPTTKPTPILAQFLAVSTLRGMIAYDPFAGSGSLMLACEPLGRLAYMLEIDPAYAACILEQAAQKLKLEPLLEEDTDGEKSL